MSQQGGTPEEGTAKLPEDTPLLKDPGCWILSIGCIFPSILISVGLLWKFTKWAFI